MLYLNDTVELDAIYDQNSFARMTMPNKHGFVMPDPGPDTPSSEPCMRDCDVSAEIIGKARILDVTSDQEGEGSLD